MKLLIGNPNAIPHRFTAALFRSLTPLMLILSHVLILGHNQGSAATRAVTSLADEGPGSLRQVVADAEPSDTIIFNVAGTISLTNGTLVLPKNLTVLGPGASLLVISGNRTTRVLYVDTNTSVTLSSVTVANGFAAEGGGVYNAGGTLVLHYCTVVGNSALGPSAPSYSGASGTNAYGGAVYNAGLLYAINCTFISNTVAGGSGGSASSPAGWGGPGADASGGAIANFGTLVMTECLIARNSSSGGDGGQGTAGFFGCPGQTGGPGGDGGTANGGALFNNGIASAVNTTFALNVARGGNGASGGSGGPPFSQSCSSGDGGHGGAGGSSYGAIYDGTGHCYFTNCTIASNIAVPGNGGAGGPAGPWPYPYLPRIGHPGAAGSSGASSALKANGAHLRNTLLSGNAATNCVGSFVDDGHNLSSDASCIFTNAGSMTNTDPKLGPLSDNGGTTLTLALLPLSPAIDAGAAAAPAIDQRGVARPQGCAPDIGAFEFQFTVPRIVNMRCQSGSSFWLESHGLPNCGYAIQRSHDLVSWADITNVWADTRGVFEFLDQDNSDGAARFYRLRILPR